MSNYIRVIPRDLFNEAKLLKCMGMLTLAADNTPELVVEMTDDSSSDGWDIRQNSDDGSITVHNLTVIFNRVPLNFWTPLNSKAAHPLWAQPFDDPDAEAVEVFTTEGKLSADFKRIGN